MRGVFMAEDNPNLIPPPSIGASPESVPTPIKKRKGGSKLWLLVLGCVVVGISLGVLVYQQSVTPQSTPRPRTSPAPPASPTTPQISAVNPSANTVTYSKAGHVRIYYLALTGAPIRLFTEITSPNQSTTIEMPWRTTDQPFAIADTELEVTAGQQLSFSVSFDAAGQQQLVGWVPPQGSTCGAHGFSTADIASYVSAATAQGGGQPLISVQCWGDSTPGEFDFNDILLIWSYTPESAVTPTPSPSASVAPPVTPTPSATATPSPSPSKTPTPSPSKTPTPSPSKTPTPSPSSSIIAQASPSSSARVSMPEGSALPEAGVFEVTVGTVSVGVILLILGLLGLLLI